jgi:hypothetical protein
MSQKQVFALGRGAVALAASFMFASAADAAVVTYGSGTLQTSNATLVCAQASCSGAAIPSTLQYTVGFDSTKSVNGSTGAWLYSYTWDAQGVPEQGGLSHFSIEVSSGTNPAGVPAFSSVNYELVSLTPTGGYGAAQIGSDGSSPNDEDGNPLFALKYNRSSTNDFYDWAISFYSDRAPMWGDIFIKDGSFWEVFNAGYTAADPAMLLNCTGGNCLQLNKTGYNWLAVPDTKSGPPPDNGGGGGGSVPEPATVGLIGLGMLAIGALRRRRAVVRD